MAQAPVECRNLACGRATFTESLPQIPAGTRLTARLRDRAAHLVGELGVPVSAAAGESGLSWPTVHQAFTGQADAVLARPLARVRVLGIDETRRGRPRFATDPATGAYVQLADRWHTGFVDIDGEQGLLGRSKAAPPTTRRTGWRRPAPSGGRASTSW